MIEKMPEELREIYRNNVFFHTVANQYEQLNGDYTEMLEKAVIVLAKNNKEMQEQLFKYAQRFGVIPTN